MKRIKPSQLGPILKGLSKLAGEDYKKVLRELTVFGFREVVMRTAVDTGFLRSNWHISTSRNTPNRVLRNRLGKQTSPISPPSINVSVAVDEYVSIYNNTIYAEYIDQGTPNMRAQPIIEPTRIRVENKANQLSKQLTAKVYNV